MAMSDSQQISIVVSVYNTEPYLARCVDSILGQSFSDFELLLVDDGSTDGSGVICDAFADQDGRVRVFHKENGGVGSARNLGIDNAQGEWLYFVDSDDELMPDGLQVLVDGISEEVDMVMAGYEVFDDCGELSYSINAHIEKIIANELAVKEMYQPTDYRYQGFVWDKLFSMSVVRRAKLHFAEDICFNEDRLFIVGFICASERNVCYKTAPVYKYYERMGGAMMSLKKGFNPKFVTDMEAQIRMREIVRLRFKDQELLNLADIGVYYSYRRIKGMMKEFRYKDGSLKSQLRSRLLGVIGFGRYLVLEEKRNKRRIMNRIQKIVANE